jgi:hypothetical protein
VRRDLVTKLVGSERCPRDLTKILEVCYQKLFYEPIGVEHMCDFSLNLVIDMRPDDSDGANSEKSQDAPLEEPQNVASTFDHEKSRQSYIEDYLKQKLEKYQPPAEPIESLDASHTLTSQMLSSRGLVDINGLLNSADRKSQQNFVRQEEPCNISPVPIKDHPSFTAHSHDTSIFPYPLPPVTESNYEKEYTPQNEFRFNANENLFDQNYGDNHITIKDEKYNDLTIKKSQGFLGHGREGSESKKGKKDLRSDLRLYFDGGND